MERIRSMGRMALTIPRTSPRLPVFGFFITARVCQPQWGFGDGGDHLGAAAFGISRLADPLSIGPG